MLFYYNMNRNIIRPLW